MSALRTGPGVTADLELTPVGIQTRSFGTTTVDLEVAPLAYLTRWRMHRATELLGSSTKSIAEIALSVGYETERAFAKVFRRHLGATPGVYRRQLPR